MSGVTQILDAIRRGEQKAQDELLPLVYAELRRFATAVERVNKTLNQAGESGERDVEAYMVLAMAQCPWKRNDEARAALAKGVEIERTKLPKLESGDLGGDWLHWIIAHALMREAQALIEGSPETK